MSGREDLITSRSKIQTKSHRQVLAVRPLRETNMYNNEAQRNRFLSSPFVNNTFAISSTNDNMGAEGPAD